MQDPNKSIEISSTSVLDLKAELFKQKEEFEKQKTAANNQPLSAVARKTAKKPEIWERQNKGVLDRSNRDELEKIDAPTLEASRAAMERKAKLYDHLRKTGISDDRLAEEVLVDFDRKIWEQPSDDKSTENKGKGEDPWVEYVDEFGRTRLARKSQIPKIESPVTGPTLPIVEDELISEETLLEQVRQRWEETAKAELKRGVGPIHYDETKEIRTKGVGFYRFSKDEEERQEQMTALKELRLETELKRATHQTIKEKRKAQLDARMEMICAKRQKRLKKLTKTESTSIQQVDITKTSSISPSSPKTLITATCSTTEEDTASKIVQKPLNNIDASNLLSNPEQAVNDLLSNIRRQVEQKRNGKVS
ncbi:5149_t:CDS:2 [Funneliformis geosporum]|uniref:14742_t:CDS:1 n=1 Tax=Funneliformis geosporum TaxID=1117311 RepID=A0A9W4WWQ6_9GLOM|nr:14742_t:CDS:2 [Funneliformis geosporum]CAI2184811.1 5149_t:CDS:2 [Funneliformis geosporum]